MRTRSIVMVRARAGILVAVSQNDDRRLDTASDWATFRLAVVTWPIPALGGEVAVVL